MLLSQDDSLIKGLYQKVLDHGRSVAALALSLLLSGG